MKRFYSQTGRFTVVAGALVRRSLRRQLMVWGAQFSEEKGLIDSVFVVEADPEIERRVSAWLKAVNAR